MSARSYKRRYSVFGKYRIVASILGNVRGNLIDVGSRDRVLNSMLSNDGIRYYSADQDGHHDYMIDLEKPLNFPDLAYDYVVALDVLEHVENIHMAFHELLRVAGKQVILALPNMASFPHRLSYVWFGRLASRKYDLLPTHQGDRHRWLTNYSQINHFVETNVKKTGFVITEVVDELEGDRLSRIIGWLCLKVGLPLQSILVTRSVYLLTRQNDARVNEP